MKKELIFCGALLLPFVSAVIEDPINGIVNRLMWYGIFFGIFLVFAVVAIIVLKKIIKKNKEKAKPKNDPLEMPVNTSKKTQTSEDPKAKNVPNKNFSPQPIGYSN